MNLQQLCAWGMCLIFALCVADDVVGQGRRGRAAASSRTRSATRVTEARTEVASQIKTLSRFLYLYGRVSKSLDDVTADARATQAEAERNGVQSGNATRAVERNKEQVRQNFANVRAGIDALDARFVGVPELTRVRAELTNARTAAREAEALVAQDRFDDAGRRLLDAVAALATILQEVKG